MLLLSKNKKNTDTKFLFLNLKSLRRNNSCRKEIKEDKITKKDTRKEMNTERTIMTIEMMMKRSKEVDIVVQEVEETTVEIEAVIAETEETEDLTVAPEGTTEAAIAEIESKEVATVKTETKIAEIEMNIVEKVINIVVIETATAMIEVTIEVVTVVITEADTVAIEELKEVHIEETVAVITERNVNTKTAILTTPRNAKRVIMMKPTRSLMVVAEVVPVEDKEAPAVDILRTTELQEGRKKQTLNEQSEGAPQDNLNFVQSPIKSSFLSK